MVEQLPAIEQKVSFLTGHGPEPATFTGALLWSVIEHSEMLGGDRRTRLRRNIVVTGRHRSSRLPECAIAGWLSPVGLRRLSGMAGYVMPSPGSFRVARLPAAHPRSASLGKTSRLNRVRLSTVSSWLIVPP